MQSYSLVIVEESGVRVMEGMRCHVCGFATYRPADVERHHCVHCGRWHRADPLAMVTVLLHPGARFDLQHAPEVVDWHPPPAPPFWERVRHACRGLAAML